MDFGISGFDLYSAYVWDSVATWCIVTDVIFKVTGQDKQIQEEETGPTGAEWQIYLHIPVKQTHMSYTCGWNHRQQEVLWIIRTNETCTCLLSETQRQAYTQMDYCKLCSLKLHIYWLRSLTYTFVWVTFDFNLSLMSKPVHSELWLFGKEKAFEI